MYKKRKQRAIFRCDFLSPVIYDQIVPELRNSFIKNPVGRQPWSQDLRSGKSSLDTVRRKLNRYCEGEPDSLARGKVVTEVLAGDLFSLIELNLAQFALPAFSYQNTTHSEIGQTPDVRPQNDVTIIRQVEKSRPIKPFTGSVKHNVNRTFSDGKADNFFTESMTNRSEIERRDVMASLQRWTC